MRMHNAMTAKNHSALAILGAALLAIALPQATHAILPTNNLLKAPPVATSVLSSYSSTRTDGVAAWKADPPEISALARTLGAEHVVAVPQRMTAAQYAQNVYDYVRNNIAVELRFGLGKGGRGALIDQSGTPFDQAELMVKLLRFANVPASYRLGTITLTAQQFAQWSGSFTSLSPMTVDARSACQLLADGGIPTTLATDCALLSGSLGSVTFAHVWVLAEGNLYDPSFKSHALSTPIDIPAALGCGSVAASTCGAGLNTAAAAQAGTTPGFTSIRNINETGVNNWLSARAISLQSQVQSIDRHAYVETIIGGKRLVNSTVTAGTSLPYTIAATVATWSGDIPDSFRTTLRVRYHSESPEAKVGQGADQTFFADELAGRILQLSAAEEFHLDGVPLAPTVAVCPSCPSGSFILLDINHPYFANGNTYADEHMEMQMWQAEHYSPGGDTLPVRGAFPVTIVHGLGGAGPSTEKHYAGIAERGDSVWSDTWVVFNPSERLVNTEIRSRDQPMLGAKLLSQGAAADRLVAGLARAAVTRHHDVGIIFGHPYSPSSISLMSVQSALSVNTHTSTGSAANLRVPAFEALAATWSTLEGSVNQQLNNTDTGFSTAAGFQSTNINGYNFIEINSTQLAAGTIPSTVWYPTDYRGRLQAAGAAGYSVVMSDRGGTEILTQNNSSAHTIYAVSKGGAALNSDPISKALETTKIADAAAARKKYVSTSAADGTSTITQVDLVTGVGGFPVALPFQRTYQSSQHVRDDLLSNASTTHVISPDSQSDSLGWNRRYDGPDGSANARLGGGWNHNYNVIATYTGNGGKALGNDSAIEATNAIAAIWALIDSRVWAETNLPANNLRARVNSMFASYWLAKNLAYNSVSVDKGGAVESFQRLADGTFYTPRGESRLSQIGVPGPGLDFSPVSFTYTGKDGDTILFEVGKWGKYPLPGTSAPVKGDPVFVAKNWNFPDGTLITFGYTTQWMVDSWPDPLVHPISCTDEGCDNPPIPAQLPRGLVLQTVSNNFGRSLTFATSATTAPVPQIGSGGFPQYDQFTSTFRITRVTDENNRYVDFGLSACPPNAPTSPLNCNTFTATLPADSAAPTVPQSINRYTYQAGSDSPDPATTLKGKYRLRRWFVPEYPSTAFRLFTYDPLFRVSRVTDGLGHSTQYFPGSVAGVERWKRGEVISGTGAVSSAIYDERNSVLRSVDPLSRVTTMEYDAIGRLLRTINPELDEVVQTYDLRSNVLSQTRVAKPGSGEASIVTTSTYGEGPTVVACNNPKTCNKPATETNARGFVSQSIWDAATGNPLSVEQGLTAGLVCDVSVGSICPRTDFVHAPAQSNGVSLLRQTTQRISASSSIVTSFTYNAGNHWVPQGGVSDAGAGGLNLTTTATFDAVGNLTQLDGPRTDVSDDQNFVWDARRRLRLAIGPDPDGSGALPRVAVRTTYDRDGLVTTSEKGTTTTATGSIVTVAETSSYLYDAVGNRIRETTPAGVTQASYDQDDKVVCSTIRMNPAVYGSLPADACTLSTAGTAGPDRVTFKQYDLAGQVTRETRGYGTAVQLDYFSLAYTPNSKADWVEDANGNRSDYVYDGHDRQCRLYFPQTSIGAHAANTGQPAGTAMTCASPDTGDYEHYTYDTNGNRQSLRRRGTGTASARTISFVYDALDRETRKDLPGGDSLDVHSRYDLRGLKLFSRYGATAGDVSESCKGTTSGLDYCYDSVGRLTRENAYGRPLDYQYDQAGNRERVTWPGTSWFVEYTYDAANRMNVVCENSDECVAGTLATYSYDNLGRRGTITRINGATSTFLFDGASRLSSLQQDLAGATHDVTFGLPLYNAASQVLRRSRSNELYVHSPVVANRAYTPDGLNRYANVGGTSFSYDVRGNLTGDGSRTFGYDLENRLTSVSGAASMSLQYDPAGRLLQTTAGGTTTFLYDGDRLTAEYNGATVLRRYVHGSGTDEPLVWYEGDVFTNKRWFHSDHQGSIIATSDNAGAGTPYAYSAYGEPAGDIWTGSRFRYTGQIALHDAPGLRLYHYKSRVYDPYLGRFLQTDTIGYKDDYNLYAYVGNDPFNNTDPTGAQSVGEMIDSGADGCGAVSCAGWAFLKGAWGALGAEGVSQVYDKGAAASGGDKFSAALEVGTAGFGGKITGAVRAIGGLLGRGAAPVAKQSPLLMRYLAGSGGRWGTNATRALNHRIASQFEAKGYRVTGGAGRASEEWIPGPGGATRGGTFVDVTATNGASTVRIQTVDTLANGMPTPNEAAAAARIQAAFPNDQLILIPKR